LLKLRVKSLQRGKPQFVVSLEGYKPTKLDRELDTQFISGRITRSQAIARINREARMLAKKSKSRGIVAA
jgi:hypothetical protein